MTGTIDVQEFINHLHKSGLVIVDKKEFIEKNDINVTQLRKRVLGKEKCSIKEIIDCKWFNASRNTIKSWFLEHDYIKEHEYTQTSKGYKIYTSAIPKLFDNDKIEKQ